MIITNHYFDVSLQASQKDCQEGQVKEICVEWQDWTMGINCEFSLQSTKHQPPITGRISIIWRRCYPKTSIQKPNENDPLGPRSVIQTFDWPHEFLRRLSKAFGESAVQMKLDRWSIDATSCFSGMGCAEMVQTPASILLIPMIQITIPYHCWFQFQISMPGVPYLFDTLRRFAPWTMLPNASPRSLSKDARSSRAGLRMLECFGLVNRSRHANGCSQTHMVFAASMMSWHWEQNMHSALLTSNTAHALCPRQAKESQFGTLRSFVMLHSLPVYFHFSPKTQTLFWYPCGLSGMRLNLAGGSWRTNQKLHYSNDVWNMFKPFGIVETL